MLNSMHKAHDPLAAEFIRTFRHEFFFGRQLLQRYEHIRDNASTQSISILLPKSTFAHETKDVTSLYGFFPQHPDTHFLSPWEFCQWFDSAQLQPPSVWFHLSKWIAEGARKRASGEYSELAPVVDYVFDDAKVCPANGYYRLQHPGSIFTGRALASYTRFSEVWCLQRRIRPMALCPEGIPLPSR